MKAAYIVFLIAVCSSLSVWANEVRTVERVELSKYTGLWNETYRIPNSFQDNATSSMSACYNTTAEYSPIGEGKISVTNTCNRKADGKTTRETARAIANVVPDSGDAKLVVNFTGLALLRWLGIGDGDYWILGLGPVNSEKKYTWALVGNPTRKYGWILSRKPDLPKSELEKIFEIAEGNGYRRSQFIFTRKQE